MLRNVLTTVIILPVVVACAGVARLPEQSWEVTTRPSGASVTLSSGQRCMTPCRLRLPRNRAFEVSLSLRGYQDALLQVSPHASPTGALTKLGAWMLDYGIFAGATSDERRRVMEEVAWVLEPNPLEVVMVPAVSAAGTPQQ